MKPRAALFTTSTHALALTVYLVTAAQGLAFYTDIAKSRGLHALLPETAYYAWSFVGLIAGIFCLISAWLAPRSLKVQALLVAELSGVVFLSAFNLIYWIGLASQGLDFAPTTQLYALSFGLGGILRIAQIGFELRRHRKALVELAQE